MAADLEIIIKGKPATWKTIYSRRLGKILTDGGYEVIYADYCTEAALEHALEEIQGKTAVIRTETIVG